MRNLIKATFATLLLATASHSQFCDLIKDTAIISSSGFFGTTYTEIFYNTISISTTEPKSILNLNVDVRIGSEARDLEFRLTMDTLYQHSLDSSVPLPTKTIAAFNLLSDSSMNPPIIYPGPRINGKNQKPIAVLSTNKNAKALIFRYTAESLGLEFNPADQVLIQADKYVPCKLPVINPFELISYMHNPVSCEVTTIRPRNTSINQVYLPKEFTVLGRYFQSKTEKGENNESMHRWLW